MFLLKAGTQMLIYAPFNNVNGDPSVTKNFGAWPLPAPPSLRQN